MSFNHSANKQSKPQKTDTAPIKKKKKKKKKVKKTEQKEPQFESFIDVPPDSTASNATEQKSAPQQDLLSDIWWKAEEEEVVPSGDEFGWYQNAQTNEQQQGVGDDGGAFGFGDEEDFEEEQKEATLDPDDWMTSMVQMDNVLDGSIQKKDPNKKNTKGKSMAAMAKSQPFTQPIPNSFGSDDFFNQNAKTQSNNKQDDDFDPFGLGNSQSTGKVKNITDLYKNNGAQRSNQGNVQNFGY